MKVFFQQVLALCVIATAMVFTTTAHAAEPTWAMLNFGVRNITEDDAATFRDLLQTESSKQREVQFVRSNAVCGDKRCAAAEGNKLGAEATVYGSIAALGEKLIVNVEVVDNENETILRSERMSVTKIEELDLVAARLAKAIATNQDVRDTAELGLVTTDESKVETRRQGFGGVAIGVGAMLPVTGYAEVPIGVAIDAAYWYEASKFAIGPRVGLRFQADPKGENNYYEIPVDLGAYFIFGLGDFAPFLGGGAGLRFISDTRRSTILTGNVIQTTHETDLSDSTWGLGTYVRGGVLLFRTYTVRVSLTIDYNVAWVELHDDFGQQSLTMMLNTHF